MVDETNDDSTETTATSGGLISKITGLFGGHQEPTSDATDSTDTSDSDDFQIPYVDPHLEIKVVAQTVWAEDRSGGIPGMSAVANVIGNRVAIARKYIEDNNEPHPLYGNGTFTDCCKRPEQFSCWNNGDPNLPLLQTVTISNPLFLQAMQIASQEVTGVLLDETKAATHYIAKTIAHFPAWAKGLEPCADIGGQWFYNNVP